MSIAFVLRSTPMIEIQHLKKQYGSSTPLKDVNTVINKGDIIAVIGPSGTGKSTLLRCINLLEKPTDGHILLDGEDITDPKYNINLARTKLGMVFQSFNLYEHLTVVENCMLAQTVILKRSRQEAYDKAMKLLESVGMDSRALQYPAQLSGGQKQRVAIARTLSTDPEIILFDEPTSALDPLTVSEVETVIYDLSKQGRTMMIVTHSMEFAKRISNRVFYMDNGEIYEDGTPEEIFDNPKKELTRKFIMRLSSLEMTVTEENHDLHAEIKKICNFCISKGINPKRTMKLCAIYEECYSMLDRYFYGDERTLYLLLEYTESIDKLTISLTPKSQKVWAEIANDVTQSYEYKLLAEYIKGYTEENVEIDGKMTACYKYEV